MNNGKPTVAVLMSTYNGEKYIREQIDSILAQKEVQIYLFIRDDSSTDSTAEIIEEYITKFHDIISFYRGNNVGAGCSFMDLVYTVPNTYDYYAYSDQDDIWLNNKVINAIYQIEKIDKPALYCSNQTLYINGMTTHNRHTTIPNFSLKATLCKNDLSGCTMVFNNELKTLLSKISYGNFPIQFRFHDSWTCLVALIYGTVVYDNNSYILYRIHQNNTVGVKKRTIVKRLKRFASGKYGRCLRSRTARALLDNCAVTEKEHEEILKEFANYKESIRARMRLINDESVRLISGENRLSLGLKVILNMF